MGQMHGAMNVPATASFILDPGVSRKAFPFSPAAGKELETSSTQVLGLVRQVSEGFLAKN